jgi:hypothetical protein
LGHRELENRFAADDKKKKSKLVKKKAPDGFVGWDEATFERLQRAEPETLISRFDVSHGMMVNLLQGHSDGYRRLVELIARCHDTDHAKAKNRRRAKSLFRSLAGAGIIDVDAPRAGRRRLVRVREDLQLDFSLNHTLSLYLVETLPMLDPTSETWPVDVLTLVESILENPEVILRRQVDRLKTEKMWEMKAAGLEYDERMAELEKIEHPKPNRDFIYDTFNAFTIKHPWVGKENIRPKSVAREMIERYLSFHEYVKEYGLEKSEGLLLRHLSQTYRTLVQTVPEGARDERLLDVIAYFRTMLARVDTSLIEEWESMLHPKPGAPLSEVERTAPLDFSHDEKGMRAAVRAEIHALVKALASGDMVHAEGLVRRVPADVWDSARLESAMVAFRAARGPLVWGVTARFPDKTLLERESATRWRLRQVLVDEADENDWAIEAVIDLDGWSAKEPLISLVRIGA